MTPEYYNGMIVYDKDTAAGRKRRFICTVATDSSGDFQDTEAQRFISNLYNFERKVLRYENPATSETSDSGVGTSYEIFGDGALGDWKVEYVYHGLNAAGLDVRKHAVHMSAWCLVWDTTTYSSVKVVVAIGASASAHINGTECTVGCKYGLNLHPTAHLNMEPSAGLNSLYAIVKAESGLNALQTYEDDISADAAQFTGWIEG